MHGELARCAGGEGKGLRGGTTGCVVGARGVGLDSATTKHGEEDVRHEGWNGRQRQGERGEGQVPEGITVESTTKPVIKKGSHALSVILERPKHLQTCEQLVTTFRFFCVSDSWV